MVTEDEYDGKERSTPQYLDIIEMKHLLRPNEVL